jgi:hypothetical protein
VKGKGYRLHQVQGVISVRPASCNNLHPKIIAKSEEMYPYETSSNTEEEYNLWPKLECTTIFLIVTLEYIKSK